jgi:uncharacterized membrane-anchored protein YhcB (DUF1043 family)
MSDTEKSTPEQQAPDNMHNPDETPPLDLSIMRGAKHVSNVAFLVALAALFIAGLVFFRLQGKLVDHTGDLRAEVKEVAASVDAMHQDNGQLLSRLDALEKKLADYEDVPKLMRRQMLLEVVSELKDKAAFLGTQLDDEAQAEKVRQIGTLLQELEESVAP